MVPPIKPITVPIPILKDELKDLPRSISNRKAPIKGPIIIPTTPAKIKPITPPARAPAIPHHPAPNFFAPYIVAR